MIVPTEMIGGGRRTTVGSNGHSHSSGSFGNNNTGNTGTNTGGTGTGTGGYSGGTGTSTGNPSYSDYLGSLWGSYQAQMRAALDKANAALDEQANVARRDNANAVARAKQGYEDSRRDSEVKYYREKGATREALANRGLMDSGAGRSIVQKGAINASNRLNKINIAEQNDLADLATSLASILAQINAQKAQNEMTMQSGMMSNLASMIPYMAQNWSPDSSDYYSAAQQAANTTTPYEPAVNNGQLGIPDNFAAIVEQNRQNEYLQLLNKMKQNYAKLHSTNTAGEPIDYVERPWLFNR